MNTFGFTGDKTPSGQRRYGRRIRLALALLASGLITNAQAGRFVIHPDGSGDYPSIQAAVLDFQAVAEGDSICLSDGIFRGAGNRDIFFAGRSLVLCSESGDPGACVIDCEGSASEPHRALHFNTGSAGAVVSGIGFRGGWVGGLQYLGGAVLLQQGTAPLFADCAFDGNQAEFGGALGAESGAEIRCLRCRFTDNDAVSEGGAVMAWFVGAELTDCVFAHNKARIGGGADLVGNGQDCRLSGCEFLNNRALGSGGGINAELGDYFIEECRFEDNYGGVQGGAINYRTETYLPSRIDVIACRFEGNWVDVPAGDDASGGGGICMRFGEGSIRSSVFFGNRAWNDGGGALLLIGSSPEIRSCTLAGNQAAVHGSGLSCQSYNMGGLIPSSPIVEAVLVAFNGLSEGFFCSMASEPVVSCTDVFGNEGGDWVGILYGQDAMNGNLAADPLFCGLDTGDLSLDGGSPCLPGQNACQLLIGALGQGCNITSVPDQSLEVRSWSALKAAY